MTTKQKRRKGRLRHTMICIRCTDDEKELINRIAQMNGLCRTDTIVKILKEWEAHHEQC